MLTTAMTTTLLPAAGATILTVGPLAALAAAGIAATGVALIAGVIAELRHQRPAPTPTVRLRAALPHPA